MLQPPVDLMIANALTNRQERARKKDREAERLLFNVLQVI